MLLGEMLLQDGLIDGAALAAALRHQRDYGVRVGAALVDLGLVPEEELVDVLGRQLRLPVARLEGAYVPAGVLRLVPERLLRRHDAFPVGIARNVAGAHYRLVVAFSDPQHLGAVDDIRFAASMPLGVALAGRRSIARAFENHFGAASPSAERSRHPSIDLGASGATSMLLRDGRGAGARVAIS